MTFTTINKKHPTKVYRPLRSNILDIRLDVREEANKANHNWNLAGPLPHCTIILLTDASIEQ